MIQIFGKWRRFVNTLLKLKKLHKLIIRSFIWPFIGTFFISIFLFLMWYLWRYINELVGKGLEWYVVMEFILYSMVYLIPMALPLAVLLSSIMTTGNLGERYELVAIKSAGISLFRSLLPMIMVMLVISTAAFFTANNLIPKVNLRWGALLFDLSHKKPALNIQDGIFFKDLEGYAIRVGHKHKDNQTLDDVLIYAKADNKSSTNIIMARQGKMYVTPDDRFLILELYDGKRYQEMTDNKDYVRTMPHNLMTFDKYSMAINLSELELKRTEPELFSHDHRMLNVKELQIKIDSLQKVIAETRSMANRYNKSYYNLPPDSLQGLFKIPDKPLDKPFHTTITGYESPMALTGRDKPKDTAAAAVMTEETDATTASVKPTSSNPADMRLRVLETARGTMRNISEENLRKIEQIDREAANKDKYAIEWHKKFTLSVSCLLLFFIGAPLGAIIRRGGFGLPLVVSILIFIFYFTLSIVGEKLSKSGVLDVWQGVWLSSFILLPVAVFLTYKASTDSRLFDADFYKKLFRFTSIFSWRQRAVS